MKLYRITREAYAGDKAPVNSSVARWAGTQTDARKIRIEFEEPYKTLKKSDRPVAEVEEIDVPTDKQGLIAFLNDRSV